MKCLRLSLQVSPFVSEHLSQFLQVPAIPLHVLLQLSAEWNLSPEAGMQCFSDHVHSVDMSYKQSGGRGLDQQTAKESVSVTQN